MKGLFPPPRPDLKGVGSGSSSEVVVLESNALGQQLLADTDVSMDDSHASGMSGITTESMTIGSPPRTQRKKRNSNSFRLMPSAATTNNNASGVSVRSRLFQEDNDLKQHQLHNNHDDNDARNHPSASILKPFDLNQEFANSTEHDPTPDSLPTRSRTSALTPFRRRHDGVATMAMRKRQAEQEDLYGRDWICDATSSDCDDAFSAAESPVDMYTSPRISPGKNSKNRVATYRSPFYSNIKPGGKQHQQLQHHKSPSHFRTLDGRTVESKNPFSPMVFDDTPTPTPVKPMHSPAPGRTTDQATTLGLAHPLLLTSDSLSDMTSADVGGKSHLVLRHKLQKRGSSPSNSKINHINSGIGRTSNISRINSTMGLGIEDLTTDGLGATAGSILNNNGKQHQLEKKASKYIRDGYPEPTGQYSFTGSPIKENFETTTAKSHYKSNESLLLSSSKLLSSELNSNTLFPAGNGSETTSSQQNDYCTNIHKIRRRNKGDDVVAAAAQGESSWKKEMYIKTNTDTTANEDPSFLDFNNNDSSGFYNTIPNNSYFYNQQKIRENQKEDSISPTDIFSFPQFRASPSDTSTLPPAPSKPVRRPPIRRYTPIRKTTGPPPTPMPAARQPRTFDLNDVNNNNNNKNIFEGIDGEDSSDDDEGSDRISSVHRRRRRPKSNSPKGTTTTGLPPSRFYSDFDVIAELGSGSFGNVYKVLSRLDGCFYAIKVANRVAKGIADKNRMLKEVYALAALSDRADTATFHIVRYHQAWMEEERLYIQTELCTTTLHAEMQLASPKQLPLLTRFKCLREILLALNFIHNNQMVHLDIKPENIFVSLSNNNGEFFVLFLQAMLLYFFSHMFYFSSFLLILLLSIGYLVKK